MLKFREALGKKVRMHVENEQLQVTYIHEKRKLEMQILKDNIKNEVTCKIISMVDDGRDSPRPRYRYELIKEKYLNMANTKRTLNLRNNKELIKVEDVEWEAG